MDLSLNKQRKIVKDREALHAAVHGVLKSQTLFSDWTTATYFATEVVVIEMHFNEI